MECNLKFSKSLVSMSSCLRAEGVWIWIAKYLSESPQRAVVCFNDVPLSSVEWHINANTHDSVLLQWILAKQCSGHMPHELEHTPQSEFIFRSADCFCSDTFWIVKSPSIDVFEFCDTNMTHHRSLVMCEQRHRSDQPNTKSLFFWTKKIIISRINFFLFSVFVFKRWMGIHWN